MILYPRISQHKTAVCLWINFSLVDMLINSGPRLGECKSIFYIWYSGEIEISSESWCLSFPTCKTDTEVGFFILLRVHMFTPPRFRGHHTGGGGKNMSQRMEHSVAKMMSSGHELTEAVDIHERTAQDWAWQHVILQGGRAHKALPIHEGLIPVSGV